MASTSDLIAGAIVTLIRGVSGTPTLIEWRKTEVFYPAQTGRPGNANNTGIVVSGGIDRIIRYRFGQTNDHEYSFQVAYFQPTTPKVPGDDLNPQLFTLIKTALKTTKLTGVPVVWDFELAERTEWEKQPFAEGVMVSRCGVLYRTNESW